MPTYPHDPDPWVTSHPPASTHPVDQTEVNYSVALRYLSWMVFWLAVLAFEYYTGFSAGVGEITASKDMQTIVKFGLFWIPIICTTICVLCGLWSLFPKTRPRQP